jgi:hypothetical protein
MTEFHGDIFRGKRTLQKNFATLAPRPRFVTFEHFVVNHRIATLAPCRALHSLLGEGGPRPSVQNKATA